MLVTYPSDPAQYALLAELCERQRLLYLCACPMNDRQVSRRKLGLLEVV